jgi:hypothetical protein
MFIYISVVPFIEAAEHTIIQKVVPLERQGRVFGFAQSVEMSASPLTTFMIGPITELFFIPFMTTGAGVDLIGGWFGTGADRGIALVFTLTGIIGLIVTLIAMNTKYYGLLSKRYMEEDDAAVARRRICMRKETQGHVLPKLAAPAQRALSSAGITQLEQLTQLTEAELLQLHGMGNNAVNTLREALSARGLSFRNGKNGGMDRTIRKHLDNIRSEDGELQNEAYHFLMEQTEKPVDWAYEAWDELVEGLTHKDNHVRAISSQLLANLGKSDPKGRMFKDFDKLLNVTRDERFVTARHCLQNIWKVGLGGKNAQQLVVKGLEKRFKECVKEKNGSLIRYDILVGLRNLYEATTSSEIKEKALELVELETDLKYRKKYTGVWKK